MPDVLGWWRRRRWDRWRWLILAGVVGFAALGVWRVESTVDRIEAERVNRCVDGRGDTRRAIVRVVDEFTDLTPAEVDEVSAAVAEEIPTAACTRTPP